MGFIKSKCDIIILAISDSSDNVTGYSGLEGALQKIDNWRILGDRIWSEVRNGVNSRDGCSIFKNCKFLLIFFSIHY